MRQVAQQTDGKKTFQPGYVEELGINSQLRARVLKFRLIINVSKSAVEIQIEYFSGAIKYNTGIIYWKL